MYSTKPTNRIFKPREGVDEKSAQSLQEVRTEVATNGRHVMVWIMRNQRPVEKDGEGSQIIRSYGYDPETGQYDCDAGAGPRHATRDRIGAFLENQGEGRLEPGDLAALKAHMGIGAELPPESARF